MTQELDSIASGPGGNSMLKSVLQFLKYFLFLAMRFLFLYLLLKITENVFLISSDDVLSFLYGPRSHYYYFVISVIFYYNHFHPSEASPSTHLNGLSCPKSPAWAMQTVEFGKLATYLEDIQVKDSWVLFTFCNYVLDKEIF